ncbi:MAG: hypothetical protein V7752_05255 [Halopseudomonas sp.]
MSAKAFRSGISLLLCLLLHGCALQQWQSTGMGRYLESHSLADTLAKLESQSPDDRDLPMHLLNRGLVHHLIGNYQRSNEDLEAAKIALEKVQAISVTEGFTSSTINETFNDYSATPSERVLLHVVMALNYLALNDLSSARVEALQSDLRMRELADEEAELASARFIAGLIFELNQEWSDAMISYRKAEQVLTRRKLTIPDALQNRLLNGSRRLGLESEYQQYVSKFQQQSVMLPENYGEVLVLYLNGQVPSKQQRRISIYAPSLEHFVSIAQPYYPPRDGPVTASVLALGANNVTLELLEDIDNLAREALQADETKRLALSLARVTTKHQLVKDASKQDPLLGLLTDMAALLTEVADTRSWNLLPAAIQIGTVQLPAGSYSQPIEGISGKRQPTPTLEVKVGATQLLIANSYGNITPLTYY